MNQPILDCRACYKRIAVRSAQGYCAECQSIYEEVMAARAKRIATQRQQSSVYSSSYAFGRPQKRVGCMARDVSDVYGFSEVDWQDALQPNEGSR